MAAALALAILLHHNRHIQPHQRPQIGHTPTVCPNDLHGLPLARERGHDLHHAPVLTACIGIYAGKQAGAGCKIGIPQRVRIRVKPLVGGAGWCCHLPGATGTHGTDRIGRTEQRRAAHLIRMGKARFFPQHRTQTKARAGVKGGRADNPIIQSYGFALAVFKEQLAIVHAVQRRVGELFSLVPAKLRLLGGKKQLVCGGQRPGV